MRVMEVIESKRWVNSVTGQTASIYGAVPYFGEAEKSKWSVQSVGWTWKMENGTIGLGRMPAATREEALQLMNQVNTLQDELSIAWKLFIK